MARKTLAIHQALTKRESAVWAVVRPVYSMTNLCFPGSKTQIDEEEASH